MGGDLLIATTHGDTPSGSIWTESEQSVWRVRPGHACSSVCKDFD